MKKLTAEWVRKADADYLAAQNLLASRRLVADPICFHCQQAVEKYLKAVLQELGLPIDRTHDLLVLVNQLMAVDKSWRSFRRGIQTLTRYAVEYRYPLATATTRQARAAFVKAGRFRDEVYKRLGIRKRRTR
jgi:HEPN domain-containing protein